tara:strand:+ start:172649 stop:173371 length:723 start_codon:yes stop_codon:yes gene_type:complete
MVYISDSFPAKIKKELSALLGKGPVQTVSSAELSRLTDLRHQGIVIRLKASSGSGSVESKEAGLKQALDEKPGLYVMLDRIQDEQNLGSIVRSAEALGAKGLIVTGKGARPGSVAARVSAGATMLLPIFQSSSQSVVKTAKNLNYWLLGADFDPSAEQHKKSLSCHDLSPLPDSNRLILVIGSEGDGMKSSLLDQCDFTLHIPLRGRTQSLNAGVATAILLDRLMEFVDSNTADIQSSVP